MADTESAAAAAADVVPTGTEDDGAAVVTETPVAAEGDQPREWNTDATGADARPRSAPDAVAG